MWTPSCTEAAFAPSSRVIVTKDGPTITASTPGTAKSRRGRGEVAAASEFGKLAVPRGRSGR